MAAEPVPTLRGERVRLRRTTPEDIPRLAAILAEPAVARWWGPADPERVRRELIEPDDDTVPFAIEASGEVVGFIQFWEEPDPDYRHAGIDLFVHPAWHGRGLGPEAIRLVARYLFDERGHHRLTIDPDVANTQAIRAYERVGFRPVGILRRYWRGPDGDWRDGLLMDLLPPELS